MGKTDAQFFKKLLATFAAEADEHLKAITEGLLEMEKGSVTTDYLTIAEHILREAHSLKGAARSVNMVGVEMLCQLLEDIFLSFKNRQISHSKEIFDSLHKTVKDLQWLSSLTGEKNAGEETKQIEKIVTQAKVQLNSILAYAPSKHIDNGHYLAPKKQQEIPSVHDNIPVVSFVSERETKQELTPFAIQQSSEKKIASVTTEKLDALLYDVEDMLSVKLATNRRINELRDIYENLLYWKRERGKPEFLEWSEEYFKSTEEKVLRLLASNIQDFRSLSAKIDHLQEEIKPLLMLPFSSVLESFPLLVRELAGEEHKEIELVLTGAEIEIDQRILKEIKSPLVHLLRNAVDHGIELPDERGKLGKPLLGIIKIAVSQKESNKVEIVVSDDGGGIDIEGVRGAAVKLGVISEKEAENLTQEEALSLIFYSGTSTSPIVTGISGRGVGLAIVKEKVQQLGGVVTVQNHPGIGSEFSFTLPVSIATFRGILLDVAGRIFVVPVSNVEHVLRIKKSEIKTVENKEIVQVNGRIVPLVPLEGALELPAGENNNNEYIYAVILSIDEITVAFSVDRVLHEQEIVLKNLGKQLSRVRNVAFATVLGSGEVALVLNVYDILRSAVKVSSKQREGSKMHKERQTKQPVILVAEDSITTRTLLKSILESAGFIVRTAVDGVDALTLLRTEKCDLVVSDVDMPRMSGFDLTQKIRMDKKLSETPVVLVTALESREDREHGIDVGANAYIVKSTFGQSNLLDIIKRFV